MSTPLFATSPLAWAVVLLVALALGWRRLPRWLRRTGVVIEVLLFALTTPLGANALTRLVESRLPPAPACAAPVPNTVVVLGGGFARAPSSPSDFAALQPWSLHRVFTAVDLWRVLPGARFVISGGARGPIPEAVPMAALAQRLGVPAADIVLEGRSRNTWENARDTAALSPAIPRRIWLVTSDLHMPRALGAFRAWGFSVCAWPSERQDARPRFSVALLVPSGRAASEATRALHELLGGIDYAWLEWRHARHAPEEQR